MRQKPKIFTARCYAERGIAMASCLSVRLSAVSYTHLTLPTNREV